MANPFTPPSISGYNSGPPPDDGTSGADNTVTWSKHKTKLADPIKSALEATWTAITSAFGKVIGGAGVTATGVNYTVQSSDQGKLIRATAGSITITTPAAGTVGAPFVFMVINDGGSDITLDGNASETINGETTLTLADQQGVVVSTDGSNWFALGITDIDEGTSGQVLTSNGAGNTPTMQDLPTFGITLATPQNTTSGTTIDFTSIPAGTQRIKVMLQNVSINGSSDIILQLGDSGGVETTGYGGSNLAGNQASGVAHSSGFILLNSQTATTELTGMVHLELLNSSTNLWVCSGVITADDSTIGAYVSGSKALSGELDRIRLTSVSADTFDNGSMNISYE